MNTSLVGWDVSGLSVTGNLAYLTDGNGVLHLVAIAQLLRIDAARNLVDDTSSQAIFPTANDALTVVAGMTYRFRSAIHLTKGANSVTLAAVFGGAATMTTFNYAAVGSIGTANTANTAQVSAPTQAASTVITAASTALQARAFLEGEFEVNAGGTFIPQVAWSGATGSTPTVAVGTWFELWPVGANPITSIGSGA
jgi:hypothetical protein